MNLFELMLYSLQRLTEHSYEVHMVDNGSNPDQVMRLKKIVATYNNVYCEYLSPSTSGSIAHASALNHLTKQVTTPYFSILDADASWLIKNWDTILIEMINKKIKVVGTQAAPSKPQDFPLMYAILFETRTFKKLKIDFLPKNIAHFQDTGYQLRESYQEAGYTGEILEAKYTRSYKEGDFKDLIVAEYYHQDYARVFASHYSRGSTLGKNKYKRSRSNLFYRLPFLGNWLIMRRGVRERNQWISICQKLIDEQV